MTSGEGATLFGAWVGVGVAEGTGAEEESSSAPSSQSSPSESAVAEGVALAATAEAEAALHSAGRLARVSVACRDREVSERKRENGRILTHQKGVAASTEEVCVVLVLAAKGHITSMIDVILLWGRLDK